MAPGPDPQQREERVARLPFVRKALFALLPALLLCTLAELFFRLRPVPHEAAGTLAGMVEPDPDLIWRLKPFAAGPLKSNELGLRDDPLLADPDPRILLLGDSVAWGDGVRDSAMAFPQVAERALRSRLPRRSVEIVNAAVPGYSTFQERRYLELRGLGLRPRLLVLQFCLNDVVSPYVEVSAYGGRGIFLGVDTREAIPGLFGWMVRHSRAFEALARLAIRRARNWEAYDVLNLAHDDLAPELVEAWLATEAELDRIDGIASRNGIAWLLLVTPYEFQVRDPEGARQPQERLRRWASRRGVAVLDLLPEMARLRAAGEGKELFLDESHFSVRGHEVAGAALAEALIDLMAATGISGRRPTPAP